MKRNIRQWLVVFAAVVLGFVGVVAACNFFVVAAMGDGSDLFKVMALLMLFPAAILFCLSPVLAYFLMED